MDLAELLSQVLANQHNQENNQENTQKQQDTKIIEMQEISPDTWAMIKR